MAKAKAKPYPPSLLELMASKTAILLKARTFADMGMAETCNRCGRRRRVARSGSAPPGRPRPEPGGGGESHQRASCCQKGGDLSRAANLYEAALAAPLRPNTRRDVEAMLAACLDELSRTAPNGSSRPGGKVQAGT